MTCNDPILTEALLNVSARQSELSAAIRSGDLDKALDHAEAIVNNGVALRLQIENLKNKATR